MEFPLDLRVGNIVEYAGPVTGQQTNQVEIININQFSSGIRYYSLRSSWQKDGPFTGYDEHLRPIYLTENILEQLGFQHNSSTRVYSYGGLSIGQFGYAEGNKPFELTGVSLGFRVIPINFPIPYTLQQVEQLTTLIPDLHSLQNYCADNGIALNFSNML
jgi:hypothetical protein